MAQQIEAKGLKIEEYEFVDSDKNHLFTVRLNASDLDIARRYDEVVEWFNNLDIPENTSAEDMFKLGDEAKEKVSYILGVKDQSEIFDLMNPFSPLENGQMYMECVVDNLGKLIESKLDSRVKKVRSRIDKYTEKYHK